MVYRKPLIAAIAGVAAVSLLAACSGSSGGGGDTSDSSSSSGSNSDLGNVVNPGFTTKGGTINVLGNAVPEHLDPVQNYVTNSGDIGRLIYRTLTVIKDTPGQTPEVKPDLASDLGVTNDDGKTWTWKLRSGLKYEDGSEIKAEDIKYNIERSFDRTTYPDGASYMPDLLDAPADYTGPYTSGELSNDVVDVSKAGEITLHFAAPQPDADWIMSLAYTAPVPQAKDTKASYDAQPLSSGPYKISSYDQQTSLVLDRNPNWDSSTDPNRPALPDKFNFTYGIDLQTISQRLLNSTGDDANAITLENSGALQNGDISKVEAVKDRFVNGPTPCVDYEYINTKKITDVDIRKAIAMAINRDSIVTTYGGSLFGTVADTIISPGLEGYDPPKFDFPNSGDAAGAQKLLQGKTLPTITYGVASTSVKQKSVAAQIQNDLKAVGITVNIVQIPSESYYTTIRADNESTPDMGRAGWCWDWPTTAAVVPQVLGTNAAGTTWSDSNFSKYLNKTYQDQIKQLQNSTDDAATIGKDFNQVTNDIQTKDWPLLPTIASNDPQVVGSNIQNAGVSTIYGLLDLNTVGVKQ